MAKITNFNRNNLGRASSPYLKQHKDNPIHWQEWSEEILKYARENDRILFVSVGYATCHWCHVMAGEAFSDKEIASYLNKYFVSIKVDREQRPDIDRYMMKFLVSQTGRGGWPLNVFLTPDLKPVMGMTYVSVEPKYGMRGFLEILKKIKNFYDKNKDKIGSFKLSPESPSEVNEDKIINLLTHNFDFDYHGFGFQQKFPPHSTLLFMLHYYEETGDDSLKNMAVRTLDTIKKSGLHDHLQGGFFRYCVDRKWMIPHFEKMLYDQAMLLWIYSAAFRLFNNIEYKKTAEKIVKCLSETFEDSGLYISAHDADTDHKEGWTYIWDYKELKEVLEPDEFKILKNYYEISEKGNFEGKNHLIKKRNNITEKLEKVEKKLLKIRKKKKQPFKDKKIITSWNCLIGIGFIFCYRYFEDEVYLQKAESILKKLKQKHIVKDKLIHNSLGDRKNKNEFLEDYASMLLLLTYLYEETGSYKKEVDIFVKKINKFKKDRRWMESQNRDFKEINADYFDHPIPSSISLVELALSRVKVLTGEDYLRDKEFKTPMNYDFLNISILIKNGLFHVISSPEKLEWKTAPLNSIQKQGDSFNDCYKGMCLLDKSKF